MADRPVINPTPSSSRAEERAKRAAEREKRAELARRSFARIEPVLARCTEVVRPIYRIDEKGVPQHLGCGVLLELEGSVFVLTAAHVLDGMSKTQLAIAGTKHPVYLLGDFRATPIPEGKTREDDTIDAAVIQLTPEGAAAMSDCHPLDLSELAFPDGIVEPVGGSVLVFGYPDARSEVDKESMNLTRSPVKILGTRADEARYATAGLDPRTHVLMSLYHKNVMSEKGITNAPSFEGMSGCGIWSIALRSEADPPTAKLAGIFTDFRANKRQAFGSRLHAHFSMLGQFLRP